MAVEFELKYRVSPEKMLLIAGTYPGLAPIQMETTYFDTPDRALSRRRWTLRRRLENQRTVYTCKTPGTGLARGEWESFRENLPQAVEELCNLGAPRELAALTANGVQSVCAARFTRLCGILSLEDASVELALDQGVLLGGGKRLPFAEAEVELKSGSREAAVAFAQALAERFGLEPEPKSKAQRAMELARG